MGPSAGPSSGGHLPPRVVPPERLRLRLLGQADHRGPDGGGGAPAGPSPRRRHRRAPDGNQAGVSGATVDLEGPVPPAGRGPPGVRASAQPPASPCGPGPGHGVDHPPPGSGRLMGRDPAALGVLADGPFPDGVPARPSGGPVRPGRHRPVHHRGRGFPPAGGVPVAGVGHGPGGHRSRGRGRPPR